MGLGGEVPELDTSVFHVPSDIVKNKEDRLIVLNDVAKEVIGPQRSLHNTHVFIYRGNPVTAAYNSGWKKTRTKAAKKFAVDHDEPVCWGFANLRVHDDLKHTFGRRLRAAGVPMETRKVLLGHGNGDITSHYSAPETKQLFEAANRVCGG